MAAVYYSHDYSVLQYVALCCSVQQCVAVYFYYDSMGVKVAVYTVLVAVSCSVLQCLEVYFFDYLLGSWLQCITVIVAACYSRSDSVLQCAAVCCSVMQRVSSMTRGGRALRCVEIRPSLRPCDLYTDRQAPAQAQAQAQAQVQMQTQADAQRHTETQRH